MPTVEVEVYHVYHVWWDFVTDTFPPLSLLTYSHHGGNMLGNHGHDDHDGTFVVIIMMQLW